MRRTRPAVVLLLAAAPVAAFLALSVPVHVAGAERGPVPRLVPPGDDCLITVESPGVRKAPDCASD
ncbi:hypothetical protein Ate02nite_15740 [Paractinoplanes tereljensis]|uniref:Secreted protein n=1 Tax=Paractinoplanes tereljensis TaxID=571912 RepID=A0A919TR50_9ACTN|nr:hypothetical protein Ate02nite_15740 [Actinoplanes tereljensis]